MAAISNFSVYLPKRTRTNQEISEQFPEWDVEKIANKTGIESRHIQSERDSICHPLLQIALAKKSPIERAKPPPHLPGAQTLRRGFLRVPGRVDLPRHMPDVQRKCAPASKGLDGRHPPTSRENVFWRPGEMSPDVQRKSSPTSKENSSQNYHCP